MSLALPLATASISESYCFKKKPLRFWINKVVDFFFLIDIGLNFVLKVVISDATTGQLLRIL